MGVDPFAILERAVQEVGPGWMGAFPQFSVVVLHGTSSDKFKDSQIIVATTHQAIRFYSAFDLIIIDEVDAYPFKDSAMLQTSVRRALKKSGKVIYLTATPSQELYLRWKKKQLPCIQIPARYHGYPLPVPKIIVDKKMNRPRKEVLLSEETMEIIHESIEGDLSQLLVFVPTVILAIQVAEELRSAVRLPPFNNFDASWVQYSYSRDEDRETKRGILRGISNPCNHHPMGKNYCGKGKCFGAFAHLENILMSGA